MREAFVIAGADHGEVVCFRGDVGEEVRYFEARLSVPTKGATGAEHDRIFEFAVLEIFIAEA